MVFVSVGTQKQQFLRIFNMVENSEVLKDDEIVAQTGNTKFSSKKIKMISILYLFNMIVMVWLGLLEQRFKKINNLFILWGLRK